jgi:hypothetical protein
MGTVVLCAFSFVAGMLFKNTIIALIKRLNKSVKD